MCESWKKISGYLYSVSDLGRVRNDRTGRILKGAANVHGYFHVNICAEKKASTRLIHRLVIEAFIGPCPDGKQCNHIDGDKLNNKLANLGWVTPAENMMHSYRHGLNSIHKLSEDNVREIRLRSNERHRKLAEEFGVSRGTIVKVVTRRTHKWVL